MSCRIYPVQGVDQAVENYRVKVNGLPVPVDTARVSAVPMNRRWPRHQRQIEQSELVNFVSFACEGENVIEIIPKDSFDSFILRPCTLNFKSEITDQGSIRIMIDRPAYFTVEPFGRRNALHIFADPMPSYNLTQDENVIYFGKGIHDVGMLELKSEQTVFIDEGALVYGCIYATDAENIKILGRGILDNSRNRERILFEVNAENNKQDVGNAERIHTIQLDYCTNIEIDGITIRDSLVYNIHPVGCRNLKINNVKIIGCWRYNSDGIDMHNCENVEIDSCFIRTFDDSVCIKGFDCFMADDPAKATEEATYHNGQVYDCFKNAHIKNCTIWNDWGKCLEIGAETRATEICDIHFENCNIIHVTHDVLTCSNGDNAFVHDITYENINVEYDDEIPKPMMQRIDAQVYQNTDADYTPKLIDVGVYYFPEYSRGVLERGKNQGINFKNIMLVSNKQQKIKMKICGYDEEHSSSDILIENLQLGERKITDINEIDLDMNAFCRNIVLK